jgi:hypothetical protein
MAKTASLKKTIRAGALLARVWPGSPPEPCWGGLLPVLGIWWVIWLTTAGSTGRCLCTKIDSSRYWRPSWVVATSPMGGSGRTSPSRGLADDGVCIGHRYRIGEAAQLPQCGPPVVARVATGASACDVLHSLPRWDDTPFGSAYSSVRCLTLGR